MVFRVNRDVVVLNDTVSGDVFLADHDLTLVNNWSDISDQVKQRDKGESDTVENVTNATPGKRSERNHPPVAQPDEFGVRPGQSTTLPVLANDLDEDGDILTASVAKSPRLGRLRPVRNGGALQIDVAESMSGSGSFVYTASDGRGGEAEARVDVRVHPWAENGPPKAARASRVVLERKGEARYNILPDWSDPDGDQKVPLRPDGFFFKIHSDVALGAMVPEALKAAYVDPVTTALFVQSPPTTELRDKMIEEFELIKSGF